MAKKFYYDLLGRRDCGHCITIDHPIFEGLGEDDVYTAATTLAIMLKRAPKTLPGDIMYFSKEREKVEPNLAPTILWSCTCGHLVCNCWRLYNITTGRQ